MDTSSGHNSESRSGETSYWVRRDNKIKGPRSRQRVITAINERRLSPADEISLTENGPWFLLEKWMNHDCNDEVLKILEGPTITEPSSELEVLEIDDSVSSESNQAANTKAILRRQPKVNENIQYLIYCGFLAIIITPFAILDIHYGWTVKQLLSSNWNENWYLISWSFWPLIILTLCLFCISRLALWIFLWIFCPVADVEEKKKVVFIGSILLAVFWLGWQHVYIRGERSEWLSGGGYTSKSSRPSEQIIGHWKYLMNPDDPSKGYMHIWFDSSGKVTEKNVRGTVTEGNWRMMSERPSSREMKFEWKTDIHRNMTKATITFDSINYDAAIYESLVNQYGVLRLFRDEWERVDYSTSPY